MSMWSIESELGVAFPFTLDSCRQSKGELDPFLSVAGFFIKIYLFLRDFSIGSAKTEPIVYQYPTIRVGM